MFETVVLLNIFGEPVIIFHDLLKNTKLRSTEFIQHLFKIEIFTITFYQYSISLQKKSINFFQRKKIYTGLWTCLCVFLLPVTQFLPHVDC